MGTRRLVPWTAVLVVGLLSSGCQRYDCRPCGRPMAVPPPPGAAPQPSDKREPQPPSEFSHVRFIRRRNTTTRVDIYYSTLQNAPHASPDDLDDPAWTTAAGSGHFTLAQQATTNLFSWDGGAAGFAQVLSVLVVITDSGSALPILASYWTLDPAGDDADSIVEFHVLETPPASAIRTKSSMIFKTNAVDPETWDVKAD